MADKKSFFESINECTVFDDEVYKKIYGYSLYDDDFFKLVETKLIQIGKQDNILAYHEWVKKYEYEWLYGYVDSTGKEHKGVIEVSRWFAKECERQWQELVKKSRERVVKKDWKQEQEREQNYTQKADLLQKKKELLRLKKLLLLN
jgi:serine/threonine protein phosphatase PrpC